MFEQYQKKLRPICCGNCGEVSPKLLRCSACQSIKYCNAECQRGHWRQCHKKECKDALETKTFWENQARDDLEKKKDATGMWILGFRLGVGDGMPINHELACQLYTAATQLQKPMAGGHPNAMLHLALHYERGIGVKQSHEEAYRYYKCVIEHPHPGEETAKPALLALSKYHKEGLGGARQSKEMAYKYYAFSKSNPENADEMQGLEKWWNAKGKDLLMKTAEAELHEQND